MWAYAAPMAGIYWHMSFVDVDQPQGAQWLGGINTEADTFRDALTWLHVVGLNPGGEVHAVGIRATAMDSHYLDRLITDPDEWRDQPMPENPEPLVHTPEAIGAVTVADAASVSTLGGPGYDAAPPAGTGDA